MDYQVLIRFKKVLTIDHTCILHARVIVLEPYVTDGLIGLSVELFGGALLPRCVLSAADAQVRLVVIDGNGQVLHLELRRLLLLLFQLLHLLLQVLLLRFDFALGSVAIDETHYLFVLPQIFSIVKFGVIEEAQSRSFDLCVEFVPLFILWLLSAPAIDLWIQCNLFIIRII